MKYAWIDAHRRAHGLADRCRALAVRISGYRAGKRGGTQERTRLTDAQRRALIRAIHTELRGACASPRITQELRERGFPASKGRVERLMRENGIRVRHKCRFKATTDGKHSLPVAPKRVWTADLTYFWTDEGGL